MTALPGDIGPAIRRASVETWSDPDIKARYPSARDGSLSSAEGFFDDPADAVDAIAARAALFGVERRRFTVEAAGLNWVDPVTGIPVIRLVDPDLSVDSNHLPARIELNLDQERTSFELFG